ncbi:MAG: saccharopine dehydrogenase family protein, partial [Kiritimatiellae bacterium]|nr:saccharopine dehydrogenase family protein [Kiritimatiellia bacterium]
MAKVMLIGAGGVAGVAAAKMAQNPETFGELLIASRTEARCKAIKADIEKRRDSWFAVRDSEGAAHEPRATKIATAQIDAMDVARLTALIREYKPDLVMNIALPYQDLAIMDACLAAGVSYLDTANYEPPEEAHFEYSWQWAYREKFEKAGLTAILGCGFDPGVTQVFSAYAQKHYFDEIHTLDILDCNGGDHGYPFATNFNPEINIREVSAKGSYWVAENGGRGTGNGERVDEHGVPVEYKKAFDKGWWVETAPMAIKRVYNFDQVGEKDMYLLHHEELESLGCNLKGISRIRFFMTFGQSYLTHLKCLENVGLTRIDPIDFKGQKIIPIEFLRALLPDPATLGPRTKGKT